MKKVIRNNIFETNSSSCHSLIIRKETNLCYDYCDLDIDDNGYVHTNFGEFGWGIDRYCEPSVKLSYAVTMVAETEKYTNEDEFYNTDGMKAINELFTEIIPDCNGVIVDNPMFELEHYEWNGKINIYLSHDGYIDHQSCDYSSLQDFLYDWGINLERFIFDENVVLLIDNDNH